MGQELTLRRFDKNLDVSVYLPDLVTWPAQTTDLITFTFSKAAGSVVSVHFWPWPEKQPVSFLYFDWFADILGFLLQHSPATPAFPGSVKGRPGFAPGPPVHWQGSVLAVDWVIAGVLAVRQNALGHVRYVLKDQLKWLPLYGCYISQVTFFHTLFFKISTKTSACSPSPITNQKQVC